VEHLRLKDLEILFYDENQNEISQGSIDYERLTVDDDYKKVGNHFISVQFPTLGIEAKIG
jgi:hypothetical protein